VKTETNTKILIVDDMPENIEAFRMVIKAYFPRYEIFTAGNGAEALKIANATPPDVIILDVRMPVMDGFELCQHLKKTELTKNVPILMVSALMTNGAHRIQGFDSGADGYLCKPFDNAELVANIRGLVRIKKSEDALREQSRNLEDELNRRTATLRKSEQHWLGLFKASPDAIFIEDINGNVLEANPAACALHGMTHEELIGRNVVELVPPEQRDKVAELFPRWITENLQTYEGISYTKDCKEVPVEVRATPFEYDGKRALLLHVRDISERIAMEKKLTRAQKLESVGILAGGIAHDFNNILTGIIGNISFAKLDMPEDSSAYEPICRAEKSAFRARLFTQQLLTFARGGSPVRKTASVRQLLEETTTFVLSGSDSICEFNIEDDLMPADIDIGQISQVIENLVINASQAMPTGGRIILSAKNIMLKPQAKESHVKLKPGCYIEISVKDNGVGISAKNLECIFDPYFTTKQTGSGLGLATSYSIIHKHGGDIIVESEIDKGTEFIVYIPASDKKLSKKKSLGKEVIMGKGHILVMDDEPVIRDIMNTSLERLGYTSVCVPDGEEAITAYQNAMRAEKPFDAVILDMTVPGGMGGVETADLLKAIDPNVKSIVSSGYATKDVMSVPELLGFSGVLTKPYSIQQLSDVLHDVLSE